MTNMQVILFLMNLIPRNWASISGSSTKCFTAPVVAAQHQVSLVRTMSDIASISRVRGFGKCCAMELCHQKKLFARNLPESLYKEFSQKVLMEMTSRFHQSEKLSTRCSRFT